MSTQNLFAELRRQRESTAITENVAEAEGSALTETTETTSDTSITENVADAKKSEAKNEGKGKAPVHAKGKKPVKEDDEDEDEDDDDEEEVDEASDDEEDDDEVDEASDDEEDDDEVDEASDDDDEEEDEDDDEVDEASDDDEEDEDKIQETGQGRGYWHDGAGETAGKTRPNGNPGRPRGGSYKYDDADESVTYSVPVCESCGAVLGISEADSGTCPHCGGSSIVNEKMKKVIRNGKVTKKKVKTNARQGLSPAQYKALKKNLIKARRKAHTGTAQKKRAKSMKIGQKKNLHEDAEFICSSCGFTGQLEDFKGNCCPDCGAKLE